MCPGDTVVADWASCSLGGLQGRCELRALPDLVRGISEADGVASRSRQRVYTRSQNGTEFIWELAGCFVDC